MFLASPADIAIYGGAAGGGKSFALLLDPLRDKDNPLFRSVLFRRESTQLIKPGQLWDESQSLYRLVGGTPKQSPQLEWLFPRAPRSKVGARIVLSHLNQESDKYAWQGGQVAHMGFDEVTHFTRTQFFYMQSRVRSMSGVLGRVRATCNPDPDSWVKEFILWWLDDEGQYAREDRAGKLRWFIRVNDELVWADTREELVARYPSDGKHAKSATFIPALLTDNRILMEKDPGYEANLNAQCLVDRERLKKGDWKIRESAGNMFRREWFRIVDAIPANCTAIRYWDRAGSEDPEKQKKKSSGDPDYTVGVLLLRCPSGIFYVKHVVRFRGTPLDVETAIRNTASQDGYEVSIGIEQDPGQAGKAEAGYHIRNLAGYDVRAVAVSKNKIVRAKPASAQAEAGNIRLLRGEWNEPFLQELENFPGNGHDDQVDGLSGALNALCEMSDSMPMAG